MKIRKLIVTCIESCFVRIVGKIGQKLNKPLFICIITLSYMCVFDKFDWTKKALETIDYFPVLGVMFYQITGMPCISEEIFSPLYLWSMHFSSSS